MELSLWPSLRRPWSSVLEGGREADRRGWHRVYVADHFTGDGANAPVDAPNLAATAVLTAMAGATDRIGLGTLVLGNTYRHPAVVANWAATLDVLSAGRLVLGIGAGWQVNEHEQYGIALPPRGERLRMFAEACEVITGLLRTPSTTFVGEHYTLRDAHCEPKPLQRRLPILVGGRRDRMLGVVARWADEWNIWADSVQLRERRAVLDAHCERIGRDPATIRRSVQAELLVTGDDAAAHAFVERSPRAAVAGTATRLADFFGELVDAGAGEVIVPDAHLGDGSQRSDALSEIEVAARAVGWQPRTGT